jgi:O-antigen/teichoic acid export membrane protein
MSVKNKIILGSSIDVVGSITTAVLSFALIRLYFEVLTIEEYGLWLTINGLASLISLVDLGVDQYFTTVVANDKTFYDESFNTEFSNSIIIKLIVASFFLIIGGFLLFFLSSIIDIKSSSLSIAKITIAVNIIYFIVSIFFNSANTILVGRNHFSLVNSSTIFSTILSGGLTYLLLVIGYGIVSFPLALLIASFCQFLFLFYTVRTRYPHIKLGRVELKGKKEMISYSFSFQILKWAHIIRTQYIVIAINNFAGPSFVAIYNITNKIPSMIPAYFGKIVGPLFPSISRLIGDEDYVSVGKITIKLTKILFRFAIFFTIAIWLFNESFIDLWIGKDKYGGDLLEIWNIIYMFAFSAFSGFGIIIYSTKKFEKWTAFSIVEIFLVVALSYLLHRQYGFLGLIAGYVIGSVPTQFYLAFIALRQINLSVLSVVRQSYRYVLVPNLPSVITGFLIKELFVISSWIQFVTFVGAYAVSHFILFEGFAFFFSKRDSFKDRIIDSFSV